MKQMIDPERFVCSEFHVQNCYSLPEDSENPALHVYSQIQINRSKDFYLKINVIQKARVLKKGENKIERPRIFDGAFKTYDEAGLEQLKRIYKSVRDQKAVQNIDPEVFCCIFIGFSIFSVSYRQSVLQKIEY